MYSKPIEVYPVKPYKIWIKYEDGLQGEIDLSHLKNRGIFSDWDKESLFEKVHINYENYSIAWNDDIELCTNSLYLRIKEKYYAAN
jgi:hypothetical protein